MTSRPVLRPGFAPVRRSEHELQVGFGPDGVVVPDVPAVRRLLDLLTDAGRPWAEPDELAAVRALRDLTMGGAVVPEPSTVMEQRLAALHGPTWPSRAVARASADVTVTGPTALTAAFLGLLAGEGVSVDAHSRADTAGRGLGVLLAEGPVRRDLLDGVQHPTLPVSVLADRWEVGPLVVPGRTACLRCVDATRSQADPRLPWVVDQAARAATSAPASPVTTQLGLALAVREVLAWVDGDVPSSWSATLTVSAVGAPVRTEWLRHPDCGCAWDVVLADELG
ncbi:hypothetical protein [Nocardioides sp. Kera G14]|uniref:hypothetical protein n=1 Tax=Nocardioides sp. Kera G14 TaxID=2884264 RepID=UPI001D109F47|nr:hypothetical protein [Nocardioides sp. Kera G14]UDY24604.1 hypothetical protein LH076_04675 [Nocardioides sp. Kera G14]